MRLLKPSPQMRQMVLERGCYSQPENERIYDKWFAQGPRLKFQAVNHKYRLTDMVICDIGCSYGTTLMFCKSGSYGIEIETYQSKFARSIGLDIYQRDFLHDSIDDLPQVEAIWCSAVLEHVESIHIFLRRMALLLQPNGLVGIYVPTIPIAPALRRIPKLHKYTTGHLYSDHINAFTPSTLRFFRERAGFQTLEVSPFLPGVAAIANQVPVVNRLVDGCVYVGRKIHNWNYPKRATRVVTAKDKGFAYK